LHASRDLKAEAINRQAADPLEICLASQGFADLSRGLFRFLNLAL
jgi:hypothetical protein